MKLQSLAAAILFFSVTGSTGAKPLDAFLSQNPNFKSSPLLQDDRPANSAYTSEANDFTCRILARNNEIIAYDLSIILDGIKADEAMEATNTALSEIFPKETYTIRAMSGVLSGNSFVVKARVIDQKLYSKALDEEKIATKKRVTDLLHTIKPSLQP